MQKDAIKIQSYVVCLLAAAFIFYQFFLQVSPSVMIPELMRDFSISIVDIGFFSSIYFWTYLVLQVPAGILVDKYGPRRLLNVVIILCSLCCLGFAFADVYWQASLMRVLMGLACAPAVTCALYLCARWFPVSMFAFVAGMVEMVGVIGGAVGQYTLSMAVISPMGWRGGMIICAIFGMVLALLNFLFVADSPLEKNASLSPTKSVSLWEMLIPLISAGQVWLSGFYTGLMFTVVSGFASLWSVPFLQSLYDIKRDDATFLNGMLFVGASLGAPAAGWLSDKLMLRVTVMRYCAVISLGLSLWMLYLPPSHWVAMFPLYLLLGMFCGSYMISFAHIREITPPFTHGCAMGFANMMCILIGAPIFQPLVGILLNYSVMDPATPMVTLLPKTVHYQEALRSLPIMLGGAFLLTFLLRETHCQAKYSSDL